MRILEVKAPAFFLLVSLVFGTGYALFIPPFQSPDEPNHFLRAYQVSEGHLFSEKTADHRLGGTLPASLNSVCDAFAYLKNDYSARTSGPAIRNALAIPLDPDKRTFLDFANTAVYAPSAYISQALAIVIMRPLGATPLQMLYGARLLNLWVWCALVFAALRILPAQKWTMAAFALLPASLVMAASCNADAITNGLCFYGFAVCLAGPLSGRKSRFFLLLAFMISAANKLIISIFIALQWLQVKPRQAVFIAAATLTVAFGWGYLAQHWFIPFDAYNPAFRETQTLNEGVNPGKQLVFIIGHPFRFADMTAGSYMRALPSIAAHLTGKFGWEKNYLPAGWIVLLWAAILGLVFSEINPATNQQRWLSGGVALLYIGLFSVTMYLLWNPVGAPVLSNLQGRYFVPVLPLVALAVGGGYFRRYQRLIAPIVLIVLLLSQGVMLWSIWGRYLGG